MSEELVIHIYDPDGKKEIARIGEPLSRAIVAEARRLGISVEDFIIASIKSYIVFEEYVEKARRRMVNGED